MLSDRHHGQGRSFPPSARSTIGLHTPGRVYWSTLAANHPSTSEKTKKTRTNDVFCAALGAEARRLVLPGPVVRAAHCKTHQKLEIFGNFVASRSADRFVGRHFLLERHFAGEMISVGKARRCPFKRRATMPNVFTVCPQPLGILPQKPQERLQPLTCSLLTI